MKKIMLVMLGVIFLAGCVTTGTKIEQNQWSQIKEGSTTKQEVINILGKPDHQTITENGKIMFGYQHVKTGNNAAMYIPYVNLFAGRMNVHEERAIILFDKKDIVEKVTFNATDKQY